MKRNENKLKIARLFCKESVVVYGRNDNGDPDICFTKGRNYFFCYDEKASEVFTLNDVNEVHFFSLYDEDTKVFFDVLSVGEPENFNIDEITLRRMQRLFKERRSFSL